MIERITDMVPLETFDIEIKIAIEGRIICFDQDANAKESTKINSTIQNENVISNSNKSFDINKSSWEE